MRISSCLAAAPDPFISSISRRYLARASRAAFLSALTRVKQSGQAYRRPLP